VCGRSLCVYDFLDAFNIKVFICVLASFLSISRPHPYLSYLFLLLLLPQADQPISRRDFLLAIKTKLLIEHLDPRALEAIPELKLSENR
jgi:hypothetical protein